MKLLLLCDFGNGTTVCATKIRPLVYIIIKAAVNLKQKLVLVGGSSLLVNLKLEIWKLAEELVIEIHEITITKLPKFEM